MICADTSSIVAYLEGKRGIDVEGVDRALADCLLALAPISIVELLSGPTFAPTGEAFVLAIPRLEITSGYWERAGKLRQKLLRLGHRAKIADSLIAQSCLDHDVPLVTRDKDFQAFRKYAGLRLL